MHCYMSEVTQTISVENVLTINISEIALNENFGNLKFENANTKLSKVQEWLVEAKDLSFNELLLPAQVSVLQSYTNQLVANLQWLSNFDFTTIVGNPKAEHDSFENQIDSFYNDVYENLRMRYLPFLREERRRENPEEKALDEEVRKASQLRADLENELKSVRADIDQIRSTRQEVGVAKGERGAVRLAEHFFIETNTYNAKTKRWFISVIIIYVVIILLLCIFGTQTINNANQLFTQLPDQKEIAKDLTPLFIGGVAKFIIIASLWYGLSFLIRNYNVNSHLAAVNRHRKAVASTLEDFLESNPPQQEAMLKNATEAMFKNAPIGFVTKAEKDSGKPIVEIVNKIIGARGGE